MAWGIFLHDLVEVSVECPNLSMHFLFDALFPDVEASASLGIQWSGGQ